MTEDELKKEIDTLFDSNIQFILQKHSFENQLQSLHHKVQAKEEIKHKFLTLINQEKLKLLESVEPIFDFTQKVIDSLFDNGDGIAKQYQSDLDAKEEVFYELKKEISGEKHDNS